MGGVKQKYEFEYDGLNRITRADYGSDAVPAINGRFSTTYQYDLQGNIVQLTRNGLLDSLGTTHDQIDSLRYGYSGNKLVG